MGNHIGDEKITGRGCVLSSYSVDKGQLLRTEVKKTRKQQEKRTLPLPQNSRTPFEMSQQLSYCPTAAYPNNNNNSNNELIQYLINENKEFKNLILEIVKKDSLTVNNTNILNWFVNNNFSINYNKGIYYAANNKKLDILNWFHNNGYEFNIKYYKHSILDACHRLDFTVVFWFRDNGYLDEFYEEVIKKNKDWINKYGLNYHACSILNWFANNYDY